MRGTANDDKRTPPYYKGESALQPFDIIRAFNLNFFLGNAVKYICRAGRKGDVLEDLEKARHYLDEEIKDRKARLTEESRRGVVLPPLGPPGPIGSPPDGVGVAVHR